MSTLGKRILSSVFSFAVWAGVGSGVVALTDSPQTEQRRYQSLSEQDAKHLYYDNMEAVGLITGVSLGKDSEANQKRGRPQTTPPRRDRHSCDKEKRHDTTHGGFDVSGSSPATGWYWSATPGYEWSAWSQQFSEGGQGNFSRDDHSSVRLVRTETRDEGDDFASCDDGFDVYPYSGCAISIVFRSEQVGLNAAWAAAEAAGCTARAFAFPENPSVCVPFAMADTGAAFCNRRRRCDFKDKMAAV